MRDESIGRRQPAPRIRDPEGLRAIARELRRQVIRMIAPFGHGYVQQGLGAADIFAALFFGEMRLDPADPAWPDRDRFLLSTAHNTAIFYATLAQRGCIPADVLASYTRDGSALEVNASERMGPVVEATCGSLGQGLSVAVAWRWPRGVRGVTIASTSCSATARCRRGRSGRPRWRPEAIASPTCA